MTIFFTKLKYIVVLLVFVFSGTGMKGQSRDIIGKYIPTNSIISKKKKPKADPIAELAYSITKNAHSDSEKVYAIYLWITSNIKYDNDLRFSKKLQKKIYVSEENVVTNVLKRRMAMCGGYAFLFRDLCEKVNVSAVVIHGYSKGYTGQIADYKKPNHTWNAVKLKGKWRLVDITWAVGYGNMKKPDNFWYLTRPEDFIYSHYPENSKWTLLNSTLSFQEFKAK